MKKILFIALLGITGMTGCQKYLDININPNYPQVITPNLYLPSILSNMALGVQDDGRYLGQYIQNWVSTSANNVWDRHGHNQYASSGQDLGGMVFRSVYWKLGLNLSEMISLAEEQERWDLAGAGKIIRAWGWQVLTDYHGEMIVSEAFDLNRRVFNYDTQPYIYEEVVRLCQEGIADLERTDGAVSQSYLGQGDLMYQGSREKWIRFAYGLLAVNAVHLSNKASYDADQVMDYVNKSMTGNADNAVIPFAGNVLADANQFGRVRNWMGALRQTAYVVRLMDGSVNDGITDPRLRRMLVPSPNGEYTGLEPVLGQTALAADRRPYTLWGTAGTPPVTHRGRFLFADKAGFPLMTYSQLQFIKAEAAWHVGEYVIARDAYRKGIEAHFDYVNTVYSQAEVTPGVGTITPAEKTAFIAESAIVPENAAELTLRQILQQKYIAQWGWGFIETWCDIRRYHYDPDILSGFTIPANLFPDNNGKPAYRMRPRFNSEYVWNRDALEKLGGLNADYGTYEMWFSKPAE